MKRGRIIISLLVFSFFLIGCNTTTPEVAEETATNNEEQASGNTITIAADGFSPKTLSVKAGTTVTFVNEDANEHWPASAMHPTHTIYPDSDIKKCGTAQEKEAFDSCRGLLPGNKYSFTFNEKGSWKYHDHLNVKSTGTIVVE